MENESHLRECKKQNEISLMFFQNVHICRSLVPPLRTTRLSLLKTEYFVFKERKKCKKGISNNKMFCETFEKKNKR